MIERSNNLDPRNADTYSCRRIPGTDKRNRAIDVRDELISELAVLHLDGNVKLPVGVLGRTSPHSETERFRLLRKRLEKCGKNQKEG